MKFLRQRLWKCSRMMSIKLDLISDLEDGNITVYDQGDFTDLCRGIARRQCKTLQKLQADPSLWCILER